MEKVLIVSTKEPGVTKLVAPVFADILVKLGRYRRADVRGTAADAPVKLPRKKRQYRRRDMKAEE